MSKVNDLTGKTDEEVLAGIAAGTVHPQSTLVAQQRLSPQAISWHYPRPNFMVGALENEPESSEEPSNEDG